MVRQWMVVIACAFAAPALGQAQTLTRATRAAVVDSLAAVLTQRYVFPDVGRRAADSLRARLRRGQFEGVPTADSLARHLTVELAPLVNDRHLFIQPPQVAQQRGALVATSRSSVADARTSRADQERRRNYYFRAYEVLPGNVAYVAFDQFPLPREGEATATAILRMLANADAVIIDLRWNRGGIEGMNAFLASHFAPDSVRVLYQRYIRDGDTTWTIRTLDTLVAPRMATVPLFLLVGSGTFSAAENFAYALQGMGRATVVGTRTGGGANSSRSFALPLDIVANMPIARVISPFTGTNWEGTGVQPNVTAAPGAALDSAYLRALRTLEAGATGAEQRPYSAAIAATLEMTPPTAAPLPLEAYVGGYGPAARVFLTDGQLTYQGPADPVLLVPIGPDRFVAPDWPGAEFRFVRAASGPPPRLHIRTPGGWQTQQRR